MLGWLIISVVTLAATGTLAYFYCKLLNYFIRMKIENDPEPPVEVEPVQRITFRVRNDDTDEEQNYLFREINNMDMKIHRT